jgi:hypothetical protein
MPEHSSQVRSNYITPQLGTWSLVGFCLLAAVLWFIDGKLRELVDLPLRSVDAFPNPLMLSVWISGIIYGFASGVCWVTTVVTARYWRWLLRACLLGGLVWLKVELNPLDEPNWIREGLNLAGVAVVQCMLFFWLRVPNWSLNDRPQTINWQFGIGDVVILTTVVAILFALAIRHPAPAGLAPLEYWVVLLVGWFLQPIIAALLALGLLHRERRSGLCRLIAALGISMGGVLAISFADSRFAGAGQQPPMDVMVFAYFYGNLVAAFVITMLIIVIVGCLQGAAKAGLADPLSQES